MSDRIRMSGMVSGMDTESLVTQLVAAKSSKLDDLKGEKQKVEWKQDIWKDLNKKIYGFYSKTLDNFRSEGTFNKKKATITDSTLASVSANNSAVTGVQTLAVKQVAKSSYITGGKITKTDSAGAEQKVTGSYTMVALGIVEGSENVSFTVKSGTGSNAKTTDITVNADTTLYDVINQLKSAGVNASYDENNQRLFISATESGKASDISISAKSAPVQRATGNVIDALDEEGNPIYEQDTDEEGNPKVDGEGNPVYKQAVDGEGNPMVDEGGNPVYVVKQVPEYETVESSEASERLLEGLGLASRMSKIDGQDAIIELNGVTYTSSSNTFNINGLTVTAQKESAYTEDPSQTETDPVTGEDRPLRIYETTNISTAVDIDGIYDMIKDFFKEYNDLIKEMDTYYNAESAKDYKVLTDKEKDAMSEEEIEKWNEKIKGALLRRDDDLRKDIDIFKSGMLETFNIDGKKYSLSSFGISTLSYFLSGDNEKGVFHIDGDPDDTNVSGQPDKLKAAIGTDLTNLTKFFNNLANGIYKNLTEIARHSELRSVYSMYDDKELQKDYDKIESDIADQEQMIADMEDKYYDQFAQMEKALAKLQDKQNALGQLLGTG